MKSWMIAAVAMLPGAANAQWEPLPEVLQIFGQGEGAWTISCQFQDRRGKVVARDAKGCGKRQERLSMVEPAGGQCSYRAAPDKPLVITVKSPFYLCPLPAATGKGCEQSFPAGASGQLEIKKRS